MCTISHACDSSMGLKTTRHAMNYPHPRKCKTGLQAVYADQSMCQTNSYKCKNYNNFQCELRVPTVCRMMLSHQFHPRIGALAAVNMNRRQIDAHNPLQEPLLLNQQPSVPPTSQVSAVAGQRLLSAMDMLKPILADSPEEQADCALLHGAARCVAASSKSNSRRASDNGSVSYIV